MEKAVQLLLKAIETDPNSGAAWYLIGRSVLLVIDGHITGHEINFFGKEPSGS